MPVFLTDFGLARLAATGSKYTQTGHAIGTPAYMAPEQARGDATLTPAADVWTLGCVLYELLAGRQPFDGETSAVVIAQVITAEPPRLRTLRPDVPAALEVVVQVALRKDPRDRYPSARAFCGELARVLEGRATLATRRRRRLVPAVVAAAVMVGAVAVLAPRGAPPARPTVTPDAAEVLATAARGMRSADPAAAVERLGRALALVPDRHAWRLERGLLLWSAGQGAAAQAEWARVPPDAPERDAARLYAGLEPLFALRTRGDAADFEALARGTSREARLARAAGAARRGDWAAARLALDGCTGWEAALVRALTEGRAPDGDGRVAEREYTAALADGIPFFWAYANRANARGELGDFAGALADFDAAVARGGERAEIETDRGRVLGQKGDAAAALAAFAHALRLAPDDAVTYFNRAVVRDAAGDYAGAVADFTEALRLDPDDIPSLCGRGSAHAELGEHRAAIADYDAALQRRADHASSLTNRAASRVALGDLAGARDDCDASLRVRPAHAITLQIRGSLRRKAGDPAGAVEDFTEALRLRPDFPNALVNRGTARREQQDFAGAEADYREALARWPEFDEAHIVRLNLAQVLCERQAWAEAIRELETCLQLAPEAPTAAVARRVLGIIRERATEGG